MQTTNDKLIAFFKENPNATKTAITDGTELKGLQLFNLLKKMVNDGQITATGEGNATTYSLAEAGDMELAADETGTEEQNLQTEETTAGTNDETVETKQTSAATKTKDKGTGRDTGKYKFGNAEYGKGPLVRAVLAKFVDDNPNTTFKQLKEIFPDTLIKRFGVFSNESDAKKLSGNKPRYFMKPEQLIKIKGQKEPICVTNQWTATLIEPFLKIVKGLGYKIK